MTEEIKDQRYKIGQQSLDKVSAKTQTLDDQEESNIKKCREIMLIRHARSKMEEKAEKWTEIVEDIKKSQKQQTTTLYQTAEDLGREDPGGKMMTKLAEIIERDMKARDRSEKERSDHGREESSEEDITQD